MPTLGKVSNTGARVLVPIAALLVCYLLWTPTARAAQTDATLDCSAFPSLYACYDALPASGGRMMLPPNKTFTLDRTLAIRKPNVKVQGAGPSTIIRRNDTFGGVLVLLAGAGDVIANLTVDGNGKVNTATKFAEVSVTGAGAVADHIVVVDARAIAVSLTGQKSRLTSSSIVGIGNQTLQTYGVWALGHARGIMIDHNSIAGSGIDAIGADGPGLSILDNQIADNHCYRGIGGGQLAIYNDKGFTDGVTIKGNTIKAGCGPTSSGMELNGRNITVSNNIVTNQHYNGIVLESGSDFNLTGNTVDNSGTAGHGRPVLLTKKVRNVHRDGKDITAKDAR